MLDLSENLIHFLHGQGCVVVSTVDEKGYPHSSCKGIVDIKQNGSIYLLDVYRAKTYENLKKNPLMSITFFDEHKFRGYCLKGRGKIVPQESLEKEIIRAWEAKVTSRLTQRLLRNIRGEKGHPRHPEALLPKPQYLIEMDVEEVIDLAPHHLR